MEMRRISILTASSEDAKEGGAGRSGLHKSEGSNWFRVTSVTAGARAVSAHLDTVE